MTTEMTITLERHPDALLRLVSEFRRRGVVIESLTMLPSSCDEVEVRAVLQLRGRDERLIRSQVARLVPVIAARPTGRCSTLASVGEPVRA